MKKVHTNSITIILLLLITSCLENEKFPKFHIGNSEKIIDFKNFVTSAELCPLDISDEFIIGEVNKIIVNDSFIYILDNTKSNAIFQYCQNGRGYNKFSNIGNGPNEYIEIKDLNIDPENKEIIILCFPSKLIITDLNLNVKRTIPLYKNYQKLIHYASELYLYDHEQNCVDQLNLNTLTIKRIFSGKILKGYGFPHTPVFFRTNHKLYFHSPGSDLIHQYNNKLFTPFATLNFNKKTNSLDFYSKNERSNIDLPEIINHPLPSILSIFETDYFFGFTYTYNFHMRCNIVYKENINNLDGFSSFLFSELFNKNEDSKNVFTWINYSNLNLFSDEFKHIPLLWRIEPDKNQKENDCIILVQYTLK